MSFNDLNLSPLLMQAIDDQGYQDPTPVQAKAIPSVLEGRDVIVSAQTGTGKTAAFTLPLLARLTDRPHKGKQIRALILTPTRELAAQVDASVKTYAKYLKIKTAVVYGGVKINPQITRLRQGCDVVIATPGRLLDLLNQKALKLSSVQMFVLDEADRMLDMGFMPDIRRILDLMPAQRQSLLFSATYSREIKKLAGTLLHDPVTIDVAGKSQASSRVQQIMHPVDKARKRELLSFLIGSQNWKQVLVFVRTKRGADTLAKQLNKDGLKAAPIHGDKSQGQRQRTLADFKKNKVRVLVATDVAARGLDIALLPHVVNFDLPMSPEDYVHRIGRTGRASNEGLATSLLCVDEHVLLRHIEKLLKVTVEQVVIDGFEPDPSIKPKLTQKAKKKSSRRRRFGQRSARGPQSAKSKPARKKRVKR